MCYPKPGPRCTPHAKEKLVKARKQLKQLEKTEHSEEEYSTQRDRVLAALKQYDATPGGLAELRRNVDTATDEDRKQRLSERLKTAELARETQMRAYKQSLHKPGDNLNDKVYISQIASLDDFEENLGKKYIRKQIHPDHSIPYDIYNYTEDATYDREWNPVTIASRGLIVNRETGEIVARPFPKFFNDAEPAPGWNDFKRTGKVEVYDKADGSCGICYRRPDGKLAIATRGSMGSDGAKHATQILNQKYPNFNPEDNTTYMFEIIYPQNRIVVNYGDMDDLVLLGGVDKKTGRSVPLEQLAKKWDGPVVDKYEYSSYEEALNSEIPGGKEGYVIHFTEQDKRVKFKSQEYIALHRVITNATPRRVWELMSTGKNVDEWLKTNGIPEEFEAWAHEESSKIQKQYDTNLRKVDDYHQRSHEAMRKLHPQGYNQKQYYQWLNENVEKEFVGLVLSKNKGVDLTDTSNRSGKKLWDMIKPEHEKPIF